MRSVSILLYIVLSFIKLCSANDECVETSMGFPQENLAPECGNEDSQNSTVAEPGVTESDLSELLTDFISSLHTYIGEDGLNHTAFDSEVPDLIEMLSFILYWEKEVVRSPQIQKHIKFARRVFSLMSYSSHILRVYAPKDTGHYLLCSVVQLNVRLFSYFEADGVPDIKMSGFRHTLTRFSRVLQYSRDLFGELRGVSSKVKHLFDDQVREAIISLDSLGNYRPT